MKITKTPQECPLRKGWEQSETRILPMSLNMGSYTCSKYIPEEYIPAIGENLDAEVGEWESYILKLL